MNDQPVRDRLLACSPRPPSAALLGRVSRMGERSRARRRHGLAACVAASLTAVFAIELAATAARPHAEPAAAAHDADHEPTLGRYLAAEAAGYDALLAAIDSDAPSLRIDPHPIGGQE